MNHRTDTDFQKTLDWWAVVIGAEHVLYTQEALAPYGQATFAAGAGPLAVLRPGSAEEVARCVHIAAQKKIPVYPISRGKNWGYGSRVPAMEGCVLLDLGRMNRIREFDGELGLVAVEPGVTHGQLADYLRANSDRFWVDPAGAGAGCSVLGNTLERGFGHTVYGDHFLNIGGLKAVLADGSLVKTGFQAFANARAAGYYRYGLGPVVDGLFSQSNLGVVVEMSVWLMPKPERTRMFYIATRAPGDLPALIDALKPLRLDGTLRSSIHIGNAVKAVQAVQQYPWELAGGVTPLPGAVLAQLVKRWQLGAWNAIGALYGDNAQIAANLARLKAAIRAGVPGARLLSVDDATVARALKFAPVLKLIGFRGLIESLERGQSTLGLLQGRPSTEILKTTYWRKKTPAPADAATADPDRDGCGLIWCSHVSPLKGPDVQDLVKIGESVATKHGFEAAISLTLISERAVDQVLGISYDRHIPGEDERALACYRDLLAQLTKGGFYPYRLGVQAMGLMDEMDAATRQFLSRVKTALDPENILSPGRYLRPIENVPQTS